jgi:quercetin dioxygenase-like cupin family protein
MSSFYQEPKMKRHHWMPVSLFAAGISMGIVGSAAIHAQQAGSPTRLLLKSDLQGLASQEILFFTTSWAPGQTLRCHIHPEAHEFAYLIEGELTFRTKGVGETVARTGEVNHVLPDTPHYGRNASDKLARTLVVRVKDKSKPIAIDVETSNCP